MMHCHMITFFMLILFSQKFSLNHHKVLVKHLGWPVAWTMLGYWDYRGSQTSGAISKRLLPGWRSPERDNVIFSWVECLFWMSSNAGASPKSSVAFSTDGEPGQRRSHWTRKTQRKAGRKVDNLKMVQISWVWVSLVTTSRTASQRLLKMEMLSTCLCSSIDLWSRPAQIPKLETFLPFVGLIQRQLITSRLKFKHTKVLMCQLMWD